MALSAEDKAGFIVVAMRGTPYPSIAFAFVWHALDVSLREHKAARVRPSTLVTDMIACAVARYGLLAPSVLAEWRICEPEDVGRIVHRLVAVGALTAEADEDVASFGCADLGGVDIGEYARTLWGMEAEETALWTRTLSEPCPPMW